MANIPPATKKVPGVGFLLLLNHLWLAGLVHLPRRQCRQVWIRHLSIGSTGMPCPAIHHAVAVHMFFQKNVARSMINLVEWRGRRNPLTDKDFIPRMGNISAERQHKAADKRPMHTQPPDDSPAHPQIFGYRG